MVDDTFSHLAGKKFGDLDIIQVRVDAQEVCGKSLSGYIWNGCLQNIYSLLCPFLIFAAFEVASFNFFQLCGQLGAPDRLSST